MKKLLPTYNHGHKVHCAQANPLLWRRQGEVKRITATTFVILFMLSLILPGKLQAAFRYSGAGITYTAGNAISGGSYTVGAPSATLSNLAISSGTLSPAFTSGTSSYTALVANTVSSITLTLATTDAAAAVTVNGTAVNSGAASQSIALNVGTNTISTTVTAQDGSVTDTYTVYITRQPPNQTVTAGTATAAVTFPTNAGVIYNWTSTNTGIGLAASGTGNIASFTATNTGSSPVTATITATPAPLAYVADMGSNTVSLINTATNTVTGSPITVGNSPASISVSPDGSRVYVANKGSGTVSVINTATNAVATTIMGFNTPLGVSLSPDGSRVYVANEGSNTVSVINTATNVVAATVNVGTTPYGVSVSPDGSRVYVSNCNSKSVSVINTATNTVTATITVGSTPYGLSVSPDGSRVYAANGASNTVSVINTATNTVTATITVGNNPGGVLISPDGSSVYVANQVSKNVSVINTATNAVATTITVGNSPWGVSVSPDGSRVYVANQGSGTVSVINTADNAVVATITGFSIPYSLGNFIAGTGVQPLSFTITVNPIVPDANGILYVKNGSTGIGNSWANAVGEVADALLAAKSNTAIKQIWVAAGTYNPKYSPADNNFGKSDGRNNTFLLVNNVKLYGGFAGTETAITGRVANANTTILSGDFSNNDGVSGSGSTLSITNNNENAYHVLVSSGAVGTALVDGFTIKGANANSNDGSITVNGNTIYQYSGGGMYNSSSSPVLTNVTLSGNTATGGSGGGMYNFLSSPVLTNVTLSGNTATGGSGGGGMFNYSSSPVLTNVTLSGNTANQGGGMYNYLLTSPKITNATFYGNSPNAIYANATSTIINNSLIYGNTAGIESGSVAITQNNSLVQGINSTTNGNIAGTTDPQFTNPTTGDFTLQQTSPVINKGSNALFTGLTATTTDLAGNPRVYNFSSGGTIDMGAYEYQDDRLVPTITFNPIPVKTFGDADFTISAISTNNAVPVTFASSNMAVATVAGNTVHIVSAGTSVITASQAGDVNHTAAADVQQTLTVGSAEQVIIFNALTAKTFGDADFTISASNTNNATPVIFTSSNTAVATVINGSNPIIHIVGVGTTTITASQGGGATGTPTLPPDVTQTLIVNPAGIALCDLAIAQTNQNSGVLCVGCTVNNPDNAVDGDLTSYSVLSFPVGAIGYVAQMLIFNDHGIPGDSVTVALNIPGNNLTPAVLGSINIESYNGNTANNDAVALSSNVVKLQQLPDGLVLLRFKPGAAYNAVQIKLAGNSPGVLSTLDILYASKEVELPQLTATTVNICPGNTATFTVSNSRMGVTYNWYDATNDNFLHSGTSFTTSNLTAPATYYVQSQRAANSCANPNRVPVEVNILPAITISQDPQPATVLTTGNTSFTVTATGGNSLTYQWQVDTGAGFTNLTDGGVYSNTATATLNITGVTFSLNGYLYRCVVTGCTTVNSNSALLTVNKLAQTIMFTTQTAGADQTATYGDADINGTAIASSGLPVAYASSSTDVAVINNLGQVHIVGVGTTNITASQPGDDNYAPATAISFNINVKQKALTITANHAGKTYDGQAYTTGSGVTITGFANEESEQNLQGALTYAGTAIGATKAGNYLITPAGYTSNNYNITYNDGTLTVTPAALTITATGPSKTYGTALAANTAGDNFTALTTVNGETVTGVTLTPDAAGTSATTGTGNTYTITPSAATGGNGFLAGNYNISYVPFNGTVAKAALTVSATGISKTYDGNATATVSLGDNRVSGDTFTIAYNSAAYTNKNAGTNKTVTVSGITLSGSASANYTLNTTAVTTANITPAAATVNAQADTKVYNTTTASAAVPVVTGLMGTDVISAVPAQIFNDANAGTGKTLTASGLVINDGNDGKNYVITYVDNTAGVITPATLIYTAAPVSKIYGAVTPALTGSVTGFTGTDTRESAVTGTAVFTTTAAAASPVGSYAITGAGLNALNYVFVQAAANNTAFTISKAALTITANNASKMYGAANPVFSATYSGFTGTDNVSGLTTAPVFNTTATITSAPGAYPITAGGAASINYNISYVNGTLTVRPLTNADLANLSISSGTLNPGFTIGTTTYTTSVANTTATVTVTPTIADATATVKVNGETVTSGSASASIPLTVGRNIITTVVTAQDGITIKTYTITVTRAASGIATLASLSTAAGNISPVFSSSTSAYTLSLDNSNSNINLTAIPTDATASIAINGMTAGRGQASRDISLNVGNNLIAILVTAEDGVTQQTYTLAVQRGIAPEAVTATNILTPNGDGKNDYWVVKDIQFYPDNQVRVFDRAGREVYAKHGYNNDWDGTLNGAPLLQGTYYYIVDLGSGGLPQFKGFISILRNK